MIVASGAVLVAMAKAAALVLAGRGQVLAARSRRLSQLANHLR